ncbi:hypothetical protein FO519_010717 [Halicephalobus sp. NKZ332]|nr:hypothetical protein FO519_010717 [Halicephalobus sp. NKZ332]
MVTIAQWNIARKMVTDSYGLVFGVDYFIALVMQSLLVRESFLVYAALHALTAVIFLISVMYSVISYCRKEKVADVEISSTIAQKEIDVEEAK